MTQPEPTAVAVARAHVEACHGHDYERARADLAPDVHAIITSVDPDAPAAETTGIEPYMDVVVQFGEALLPGTTRVSAAMGDETRALLQVSSRARFGPDAPEMALHGARLYRLDENGKIAELQVIFYAAQ